MPERNSDQLHIEDQELGTFILPQSLEETNQILYLGSGSSCPSDKQSCANRCVRLSTREISTTNISLQSPTI